MTEPHEHRQPFNEALFDELIAGVGDAPAETPCRVSWARSRAAGRA
jgi:hypothetical protein